MATKMSMPKLSDTMEEGIILKWRKKEGDAVRQGDIIADVQSDKADMELEAYDSGVILKIFAAEGSGVKVGNPLVIIGKQGEDISTLLKEAPAEPPKTVVHAPQPAGQAEPSGRDEDLRLKVSPLARRIAQENNVDLSIIPGSGPQGRIVKKDVEAVVARAPGVARKLVPGKTVEVPLSLMRKTIAKRLVESKTNAPHFYVTSDVDARRLVDFRTSVNSSGEYKISYNDIVIKAVALTLRKHPKVNASWGGGKLIQHGNINIGVAVALEDGLITPVIRNADVKRLDEISLEAKTLATKAREKKLKPDEFQGGTFTVSNLGMYDVENFAAVINPPEGAILAVGSIVEKPVVDAGHIVVGRRMKMTLSCDHRVIDGAVGAQFLQDLRKLLENPVLLVM